MEKRKHAFVGFIAAVLLTVIFGFSGTVWAQAEGKCATVVLQSHAGASPEIVTISKGDCVVWVNMTRGEDLKVVFKEGTKCKEETVAPGGFKMDSKGCYVTDYLKFGQTSSLVFVQTGRHDYEIDRLPPRSEGKIQMGAVIVK